MLMTARMTNPAFATDGAMDALNALAKAITRARVPISRELVHLRASQINGCSVCVDMHAKAARKSTRPSSGALVLDIATVNLWNRLNTASRQVVGEQSW